MVCCSPLVALTLSQWRQYHWLSSGEAIIVEHIVEYISLLTHWVNTQTAPATRCEFTTPNYRYYLLGVTSQILVLRRPIAVIVGPSYIKPTWHPKSNNLMMVGW